MTDTPITIEDLEFALNKVGSGISHDGLSADVLQLLPQNVRNSILLLFQIIYNNYYPLAWGKQLLQPIEKKGHTYADPKLRGIAISPLLSRVYDIIIDRKFSSWYKPNPQQAGFRKSQGCLVQIFALFLLLDLSKYLGREIFIGLLDYEKAFDFMNRATILKMMMEDNMGRIFTKNFARSYYKTSYIPKFAGNSLGDEIQTNHGVTQGRNSSCNFFFVLYFGHATKFSQC